MGTLFTRLLNPDGTGRWPAIIEIAACRAPAARGGTMVGARRLRLETNPTGYLSTPLIGGKYRVWIDGGDPRTFTMPADDGTYLLPTLLGDTSAALALTYRYNAGLLQIINGSTGAFQTVCIRGTSLLQLAVSASIAVPNYQWANATTLQLWNPDTAAFHAVWITGSVPQFAIGSAGSSYAENARIRNGAIQILNQTTGLFHTVYLTGSGPQWVIAGGEA